MPANVVALAEDDRFNSLRLGVSAQVMLTDRLKLTAEAAYLPWANFKGRDDHNLRQLLVPEASASGKADRCRQARRELQVRLGGQRRAALMPDVTK